jgi:hypothetical protein
MNRPQQTLVWEWYSEYEDNVIGIQHAKGASKEDERDDYRNGIEQACQTCSPQAACDPLRCFMQPDLVLKLYTMCGLKCPNCANFNKFVSIKCT